MSTPYIRKAYFVFFSFFFFYILLDEKVCKKTDSNRWPCKEKVGTCYPTFNRVDFYLLLASTLNTHYAAMPLNCFFHLPQHFVPPRFVPVLALPSGGMVCHTCSCAWNIHVTYMTLLWHTGAELIILSFKCYKLS